VIDTLTGEKINVKTKCNINGDQGQCPKDADKYIFGITLCDNHYYLISGQFASNNVIKKTRSK